MKLFITLLFTIVSVALHGQTVVASTGWTGAFAVAAGATNVHVLAPYEMTHPPEYELRPSDLPLVAAADLVVYAGYEVVANRLVEAVGGQTARALRIRTGYTLEILTSSIRLIADALGNREAADASIGVLSDFLESWRNEISSSHLAGVPAVVHFHQLGLAEEIGLTVAGVFGPGPLEARQIAQLTASGPHIIIDNGHNPMGGPLVETTGAKRVEWINFPGREATRTLDDVLEYNRDALLAVQ